MAGVHKLSKNLGWHEACYILRNRSSVELPVNFKFIWCFLIGACELIQILIWLNGLGAVIKNLVNQAPLTGFLVI